MQSWPSMVEISTRTTTTCRDITERNLTRSTKRKLGIKVLRFKLLSRKCHLFRIRPQPAIRIKCRGEVREKP